MKAELHIEFTNGTAIYIPLGDEFKVIAEPDGIKVKWYGRNGVEVEKYPSDTLESVSITYSESDEHAESEHEGRVME